MRQITHLILSMLMCFCCTWQAWAGYSGTPSEPSQITAENYSTYGFTASNYSAFVGYYGISSAEELYGFAAKVNSGSTSINGVLTADIVVNDSVLKADGSLNGTPTYSWTPIGTESYKYAGIFDGNGHTVSGLYYNNYTYYVGLFGYVSGSNATIKNVGVIDSYFYGSEFVGGVVGKCESYAKITNCYNNSTVSVYNSYAFGGGVCGYAYYYASITNCYNTGKVNSKRYAGGVCGLLENYCTMSDCYNVGSVYGTTYVGGVTSNWGNTSTITNCYYLTGCAVNNYSTVQYGLGLDSSGSLSDVAGKTTSASSADFKSGKVATALGFYQTIGTDSLPVLDKTHGTVYRSEPCPGEYSNEGVIEKEHNYVDGVCTGCGKGENEPLLVDGWYEISNSTELYWFAARVNSGYNNINGRLVADIVVNDSVLKADGTLNGDGSSFTAWTPIGTSSYYYAGTFDGQGYTVSGLYFNNTNSSYIGLFGYMYNSSATIKNVGVVDSYFYGYYYVAGICGYNQYGKIINCYNSATVYASYTGDSNAGGICGGMDNSSVVENCYNTGYISGARHCVGGICGGQWNGRIINSYNTGAVYANSSNSTGNSAYVGGISGYMGNSAAIDNSYNTGDVEGKGYYAGGIIGYMNNTSNKVTNCFNTGNVKANSYASGIAGYKNGTTTNNFALSDCAATCTGGQFATADDFAGGKVAYKLNKGLGLLVWYQTIGEDELPVMDNSHSIVYASAPCASYFSNIDGVECDHSDCDAFAQCPACGEYINVPVYIATAETADSLGLSEDFVGYYAIENASHLYWFANLVNSGTNRAAKAVLTADITVNEDVLKDDGSLNGDGSNFAVWTPIGSSALQYTGTFDGNNHTISGLYFNDESAYYVGLFGYINNGYVNNLGIADSYFYGYQYVGAFSGYYGTITNCHNAATVKNRSCYVGGICGYGGNQTNCYNTGVVSGYDAGGICGESGYQTNCYNTGTVSGTYYVGGIIGRYGTQTKCYNTGTVSGNSYIGGISGDYGTQNYCYNAGEVSGQNSCVGGICGRQGSQTGCFNVGEVSGPDYVGGICGQVNSVTRSYCLEGTADNAGGGQFATDDEFASGKVAYLLNGKTSTGTLNWYQTLGSDELPVWDNTHSVVYASTPCAGQFSNTEGVEKEHATCNALGQCPDCGEYLISPLYVATADIADSLGLSADYVGFYAIENAAQLYGFANLVNGGATSAKAVLLADITVNEGVLKDDGTLNGDGSNFTAWTPIGTSQKQYYGTFDGQGHTISGIYFNDEYAKYVGLFGYVSNPTIKNISLADSYITGHQYVGGFCGFIGNSAKITNCHNEATVYASYNEDSNAGGICGYMGYSTATISGCTNDGYISVFRRIVGGICGFQSSGTITNCHNNGRIYADAGNNTGNNSYAGGISGYMNEYSYAIISNCYNTGAVEGKGTYTGGITGRIYGTITNCFNVGMVTASSYAGAIYGYNNSANCSNNFALKGTATSISGGQFVTAEQFAGGMVAYKLNGESSENPKWFQTIGEDAIPVMDSTHATVYSSAPCPYTNDTTGVKEHNYVDDVCTNCGHVILPELVDGWYEIASVGQLLWFADTVNSNSISIKARLVADIVLNDSVLNADGSLRGTPARIWEPIGNSSYKFNGEFDGQGHTISGVYINGSNSYVGLFGYIDAGKIKNVTLADSYIKGKQYVGGICGYINGAAQISNCLNAATVYSGYNGDGYTGGICGYMSNSSAVISGCTNTGFISVYGWTVGGICGYQSNGTTTNCHNSGRIYADAGNSTGNSSNVGGIVGYLWNWTLVENSYNTGSVEGKGYYVGGIAGFVYGRINNCYNIGAVTASSNVGAIYGYNWSASTSNNYALSGSAVNNNGGTFYPATDFASGKVAYLLNNSVSGGTIWRQTIGTDAYPTLDTASLVVYTSAPCPFSNNSDGVLEHDFEESTGFCTHCGAGTAPELVDGWYEISKAAHLYWLADTVNNYGYTSAKARLVADIVVNDSVLDADGNPTGTLFRSWTPIGTTSYYYQGTFDGQNHTISGLYFNNTSSSNYPSGGQFIGLFGYTYNAKISNVGVTDTYFNGYRYIGGIVGWVYYNTTITNCYSEATLSATNTSDNYLGGIAGGIDNYSSNKVTGCYSIGKITGKGYYVGALCGLKYASAIFTNCYYADSCAVDGDNVEQFGLGAASRGTSVADMPGSTSAATAADFASGRATFGLNGGKSDSTVVWRQTIGTDLMPVWDTASALVYASAPCPTQFSNTPGVVKQHAECNALGQCPDCGQSMAYAVLIKTAAQADSLGLSSSFVGYYAIANAAQLYWFADTVNAGFTSAKGVLVADIVVNENVLNEDGSLNGSPEFAWTPMGSSSRYFTGTFDGNNHTISGLYLNSEGSSYVGLFGYISGGYVKNLGIVDSYIYGYQYVGAISGYSGNITNCYNAGTVKGKNQYIGGICGYSGTQTNCYNEGTVVSGSNYAGGICGMYGNQYYCHNTGTVSGTYYVGGICGYNGTENYCYNAGTVSGYSSIGGISAAYGSQYRCFNIGAVTATNSNPNVGAISGYQGTQTYCYYLAGSATNGGGGISATTADFASGKVAYGLNGNTSAGTLYWYQTIGTDSLPVWDNTHGTVYGSEPCHSAFGNSAVTGVEHVFDDFGTCTICGAYMEATYIADAAAADSLGLSSDYVGYYAIGNAAQLYWFADKVNMGSNSIKAVLTADIVVNDSVLNADGSLNGTPERVWTPIGTNSRQYSGTFDGQGHTVSGLYFNNTTNSDSPNGGNYVGLFGYVSGGTIKNVGVVDSYLKGYWYVGGIVGRMYNGTSTISNCFNEASIYTAHNSYAFAGGICGHAYGSASKIINCYNIGKINGSGEYTGGICGILESSASVSGCFNAGSVTSTTTSYLASIAPIWSNNGTVNNSYYLEGTSAVAGNGISTTAAEFASGKITYLLNGSGVVGYDWYQTLGSDTYPVLDNTHALVWRNCDSTLTNDSAAITHHFVNGVCSVCGAIDEVPALVDGWYLIDNHHKLYWFANKVNSGSTRINGKLTADIVVNENVLTEDGELNGDGSSFTAWTPIGTTSAAFAGKFDGQGHTISGLYFNNTNGNYVGLFGYTGITTITNVGVIDSYFYGYQYVGGICGEPAGSRSEISNCYNTGYVGCYYRYVGGIAGYLYDGKITNCYNSGNVYSYASGNTNNDSYTAGIAGYAGNNSVIENSHNTGAVESYGRCAGGIIGFMGGSSSVNHSYNTGKINAGGYYAGGIAGYMNNGSNKITSCFSTGTVAALSYGYGITGQWAGSCTNNYALSGSASSANGGTFATAEEFASGKVAYGLNGSVGGGTDWFQNLSAPVDSLPVLDATHGKVYRGCGGVYVNDPDDAPHHFVNGRCTVCGEYIEPTFVDGWYEIANTGNLYWFADKVNSGSTSIKAKLVADIVVNDSVLDANGDLYGADSIYTEWTPIGTNNYPFAGTFDGQGHTVSGLFFHNTTSGRYPNGGDYVGLIGCAGNATIKNVGIINSYLHGTFDVGAILGYTSSSATITNCFNTSTIIASASYACAGGISGYNGGCTITNCYSTGKISGNGKYVGGIVGEKGGTINNCFYLDSCAFDGSNVVQFGVGNSSQGYSRADVEGCTTAATAEEFASGKIAYLLNGSNGGSVWFQNLTESVDYLPVLDSTHAKVWLRCDSVFNNEGAHKADRIVKENVVEATFTTAGSYDLVVYCSLCGEEISRTHVDVPVLVASIKSIELKKMPKVNYIAGEKLDVSGAVVLVTFTDGTTKEVALTINMISGFDAKKVGEQKLTVTYTVDGVTATTTFTVKVEKNTAIADVAADKVSIFAINRTIVVETAEPSDEFIHVFDANGRLVAKELATSNRTEIAMTRQGLYIVRIGDKVERVVVY
ncbi:MAG: bacterial Ig-like domain-containing protein [Salinivirgaceae bacterium]|nr:bacterial Ig-like domain-containing protein [Salinivirgaceae bacterium]